MFFRTDLAMEAEEFSGGGLEGVQRHATRHGEMTITRITISTQEAAKRLDKPVGTYITIEVPPMTDDFRNQEERIQTAAKEIRSLLPEKGLVLVAGLGNSDITPDDLGPRTANMILATQHCTEAVPCGPHCGGRPGFPPFGPAGLYIADQRYRDFSRFGGGKRPAPYQQGNHGRSGYQYGRAHRGGRSHFGGGFIAL